MRLVIKRYKKYKKYFTNIKNKYIKNTIIFSNYFPIPAKTYHKECNVIITAHFKSLKKSSFYCTEKVISML